jgi:hypothetical protein
VIGRPLLTRTTLMLLLALAGLLLAGQPRLILERYGQLVYFVLIGLIVVGLATLARPRPK